MTLNATSLKRIFPRCSESFLEANSAGVSDAKPQRKPGPALDRGLPREEESAHRTYVRIVRFSRTALDKDNLYGGAKACLDRIKESGLILDDSEKHIFLVVDQESVDTESEERTEIELIWPNG